MRSQARKVVFDTDWSDAGMSNFAYWCTGMSALSEVCGFEELSGCVSVTQMFTSRSHLESVFATGFDNSSITSYT